MEKSDEDSRLLILTISSQMEFTEVKGCVSGQAANLSE